MPRGAGDCQPTKGFSPARSPKWIDQKFSIQIFVSRPFARIAFLRLEGTRAPRPRLRLTKFFVSEEDYSLRVCCAPCTMWMMNT